MRAVLLYSSSNFKHLYFLRTSINVFKIIRTPSEINFRPQLFGDDTGSVTQSHALSDDDVTREKSPAQKTRRRRVKMFFSMLEWRVENLGCWNGDFHDRVIPSPPNLQVSWALSCTLELYPRGLTGSDEYMVLRVCYKSQSEISGEISFVGSDEHLLCVQQVDFDRSEEGVLILPPGPKFQDVVAEITKNEATHEDKLTVRLEVQERSRMRSVVQARTKIKVVDVTFKTRSSTFEHFRYRISDTIHIADIPPFTSDDHSTVRMALEGTLKGTKVNSKVKLSLLLHRRERDPASVLKDILVYTRVSALEGGVTRTEKRDHVFVGETEWMFCGSLMRRKDVENEGVTLILRVKIVPSRNFEHKILFEFDPRKVDAMRTFDDRCRSCRGDDNAAGALVLSKDLSCLFRDQDFSDFRLKCDGVTFPVHRVILSARSPVFKSMLSTEMKEAASGTLDIEDIDPSTLGLFLTYMYTGAVEDLQGKNALKLYYAADKYQVHSLKSECSDFLCASVSVSNVCDVLTLADQYQDERMTSAALDFIKKSYDGVVTSREWEVFLEEEPLLAAITLSLLTEMRGK